MKEINFKDLAIGDTFKISADSSSVFIKATDNVAVCTNSNSCFDCPINPSTLVFVS